MKFQNIFNTLFTIASLAFGSSFTCTDGGAGRICFCNGNVYYGRKYLVGNSGVETNLTTIQKFTYYVQYNVVFTVE